VTLGVLMNKLPGLPHADAAAILQQGFGLSMSRSGTEEGARVQAILTRVLRTAQQQDKDVFELLTVSVAIATPETARHSAGRALGDSRNNSGVFCHRGKTEKGGFC
jgi:hypothetical protein